jgi:aspartyl-tRNA(Asn)/glutamyl-tRNA(Gln) amidotransferase subunit A
MELTQLTLSEAAEMLLTRKISPTELTQACLNRIEAINPLLNSFISVTPELALEQAQSVERNRKPYSYLDPLYGIPFALKDLYDIRGLPTTAASPFFLDAIADKNAEVVERLNEAGAIQLGKLNMHEIALGTTNVTSHFGVVRNPYDTTRITGGSSGGSGAAVAARLCFGSLGSDTGGSIRIPASLCGIVGLKPTYGRVSTRGVFPLSWTLDHVGPMARTVRDAALIMNVIAGHDPDDPYSASAVNNSYTESLNSGIKGWRVAVARGTYFEGIDPEVSAAFETAVDVFRQLGSSVQDVQFPYAEEGRRIARFIMLSDAAAFHRQRLDQHAEQFGADVITRLRDGMSFTGLDVAQAHHERHKVIHNVRQFFRDYYDVLLLPSTPMPAVRIDAPNEVAKARADMSKFTGGFNTAGTPALSVPCGFTSGGLPIGLQIVGAHWNDAKVLAAGYAYEQATEWHKRHPRL